MRLRLFLSIALFFILSAIVLGQGGPTGGSVNSGVRSLNGGRGAITLAGAGGVTVGRSGQTITITGAGSDIEDTDDLPEGDTNLYYTDERAQDAIDGTSRTLAGLTVTGLSGFGKFTAGVLSAGALVAGDIPDISATYSTKTAGGDLSGTLPSPTVATVGGASAANIGDAVTKKHSQNTDTGTTSSTWTINSGGSQGIFSTASLTGNRTFTLPDHAGSTLLTTGSSTTNLPEGSNQYFTNARVDSRLLTPGPIGTTTPNVVSATGVIKAVTNTATNLTLTTAHNLVNVDSTSGARTITLPLAAANGAGRSQEFIIVGKTADLNAVSVQCAGSDTFSIGGTSTSLVSEDEFITLRSDGVSEWIVLSRGVP